jgi:hypothetical protein
VWFFRWWNVVVGVPLAGSYVPRCWKANFFLLLEIYFFDVFWGGLLWSRLRADGMGWVWSIGIFAAAKMAHLSDDETVAKMGHPDLDVGHPSFARMSTLVR